MIRVDAVNEKSLNDVGAAARTAFPFNTPSPAAGAGATTAPGIAKRIVKGAEDLLFFTDTDQSDYPIYIADDREAWLKKKPENVAFTVHVKVKERVSGGHYFKSEESFREASAWLRLNDSEIDERVKEAVKAVLELERASQRLNVFDLEYEVYAGDHERLIGAFKASAVKVTATSDFKCWDKQAWAISFEWEKRIKAKYPTIAKYVYAKAIIGRRNYARVIVKVPFPTKELEEAFNRALATAATQVLPANELEGQVKQIEELIKRKENELQALREQLQQLRLKLQLEAMKRQVVE
ncbi:MAG: hypothetical protein QXR81_06770 [Candidatus Nezhaarchaeales archaeon]